MTPAVQVESLTYRYGRKVVLNDISWSIGRGVTALLGPNGSGKTTLLKCIVGLLTPVSGRVALLESTGTTSTTTTADVGYVPQSAQLPSWSKVADIVGYAAWLSGVPDDAISVSVDRTLTALDLLDLRGTRIRALSGGQRQRVAIASGIVHDPSVLVLDEPSVGLDPGQRLRVRRTIEAIGRERSVVLSTHLIEDVQHVADTVAVLVGGAVRFSGPVSEFSSNVSSARPGPGTEFERAYDELMTALGADE